MEYDTAMKKFGIYIHFPYCLSKCPYCDFASTACRHFDEQILQIGYLRDLQTAPKYPVSSVFFGGGTPSMMSVNLVDMLLRTIAKDFTLQQDTEITMEANPDAIDIQKMRDFKACGVNRLSLGVQALNDLDLKFLGRLHSQQTACQRIDEMKSVFDNCSIDLIYARPHQTLSEWEKELKQALNFDLPHMSLYELTIEEECGISLSEFCSYADVCYDNHNIGATIASGTYKTIGMVVCPCSMKTVAGIAHGYSDNLLLRAADVVLKEQRKLVLVTRESPLSKIHLDNMAYLAGLPGVFILPPVISYYSHPKTLEDVEQQIVGRILDRFDIDAGLKRWNPSK